MDEMYLHDACDEPAVALKRRASDVLTIGSSRSLESSAVDMSASNSSLASAANDSLPGVVSAPLLIPTPSMPSSQLSDDLNGRSEVSSPYTSDEVVSILKAEKLVGQLRHRFDCQPDRYAFRSLKQAT